MYNNLNLIRLLCALQVLFHHSYEHFDLNGIYPSIDFLYYNLIIYFPGLIIFFFLSGYLITESIKKSENLKLFFLKRFNRIYPSLILCNSIALIFFLSSTYYNTKITILDIFLYFITNNTFFQFYTPLDFKGYGLGVLNGSTWTIAIELQFYFIIGLFYKYINANKLILFCIISFLFYYFYGFFYKDENIYAKLIGSSFFPYSIFFLFGILLSELSYFKNFIKKLNPIPILLVYLLWCYFFSISHDFYTPKYFTNSLGLFSFFLLFLLTFSFGFSKYQHNLKWVNKFDLSYGIYLYHGVIINYMIENNYLFRYQSLLLVLAISFIIAFLNNVLIEKSKNFKLKL